MLKQCLKQRRLSMKKGITYIFVTAKLAQKGRIDKEKAIEMIIAKIESLWR